MKALTIILAACFFALSSPAQTPKAVYNSNEDLIAIYNLSKTYDCGTRKITGTIKAVRNDFPIVYFDVQVSKKLETVEIQTDILSNADRANLFADLIKKGRKVSIDGYTCGSNGVLGAISIERYVQPKTGKK